MSHFHLYSHLIRWGSKLKKIQYKTFKVARGPSNCHIEIDLDHEYKGYLKVKSITEMEKAGNFTSEGTLCFTLQKAKSGKISQSDLEHDLQH